MMNKLCNGFELMITQPPVAQFENAIPENLQSTLPQIEELVQELKEIDHDN
jgi:hypothetical protein